MSQTIKLLSVRRPQREDQTKLLRKANYKDSCHVLGSGKM